MRNCSPGRMLFSTCTRGESSSSEMAARAHTASWDGTGGHDRASEPADTPSRTQDAAHAGGFTILIADNEAGIRMLAGEVLRSHGYTVLQAADGVEALELAAQHPGPIYPLWRTCRCRA